MLKEKYSIHDVALMTGLTTRTIRNYLNDGQIVGEKIGGKWFFTHDHYAEMLENPYVAAAIKAKHHAPVLDFMRADKKPCQAVCLIIDRCVSEDEAMRLSDRVCSLVEEYDTVVFRFEKKKNHVRMILTGPEEAVKKIYFDMDNDSLA